MGVAGSPGGGEIGIATGRQRGSVVQPGPVAVPGAGIGGQFLPQPMPVITIPVVMPTFTPSPTLVIPTQPTPAPAPAPPPSPTLVIQPQPVMQPSSPTAIIQPQPMGGGGMPLEIAPQRAATTTTGTLIGQQRSFTDQPAEFGRPLEIYNLLPPGQQQTDGQQPQLTTDQMMRQFTQQLDFTGQTGQQKQNIQYDFTNTSYNQNLDTSRRTMATPGMPSYTLPAPGGGCGCGPAQPLPIRQPKMPVPYMDAPPPSLCPCEGTMAAMMSGQVITPEMLVGSPDGRF